MKTIYKYRVDGVLTISLPTGAKVIHTAMQDHAPHIWVEYPIDNSGFGLGLRRYTCYGTGFEVDEAGVHVGSVIDNMFVWHIYEVKQ